MENNEEKENNNYFLNTKRKKNYKFNNKQYFPINDLPDDILEEIFIYLNTNELCQNASLVCKRWLSLIDKECFWVQKCLKDFKLNNYLISKLNENRVGWNRLAKHIYMSSLFCKNLLLNSCATDSFDNWCFIQNFNLKDLKKSIEFYNENKIKNSAEWKADTHGGGFQEILDENNNIIDWIIESDQTGSYQKLIDNSNQLYKNFSTSFGEKMQLIDLATNDMTSNMYYVINELKPDIEISEYYTARRDCGCEYYLSVFLISETFELIDSFQYHDKIEQMNSEWKCISHVFNHDTYTKSIRYILFYHCGIVSIIFKICSVCVCQLF